MPNRHTEYFQQLGTAHIICVMMTVIFPNQEMKFTALYQTQNPSNPWNNYKYINVTYSTICMVNIGAGLAIITGELHRLLTWQKHAPLPPSTDGAQNNLCRRATRKELSQKQLLWIPSQMTFTILSNKYHRKRFGNKILWIKDNQCKIILPTSEAEPKKSIKTSTRAKPVARVTTE